MDLWRYFELTHSTHDLLNPLRMERIDRLGEVLGLGEGSRVLDVACGHAAMLLRWHERHGVRGLGVDASPYGSARARRRVVAAGADDSIEIRHGRGEDLEVDEPFDVACCLGASWIWSGHEGTLRALAGFARPRGHVVTGEPYWRGEPPQELLDVEQVRRETFHDLDGCRRVALDQGLELVWMTATTEREWDDYEMRQTAALSAFAREHPDDEDLDALRAKRRRHEEAYLRWGRDLLGWAVWVFAVPEEGERGASRVGRAPAHTGRRPPRTR